MRWDCPFIWRSLVFIQAIIPSIRQMTFAGFRIVFSSVIPLDVPPETTDIWRTAIAFGAECYKELNPRITHVVANKVCYPYNFPQAYEKIDGFLAPVSSREVRRRWTRLDGFNGPQTLRSGWSG